MARAWGPYTHIAVEPRRSDYFQAGLIAPDAFSHSWFGHEAFRPEIHSLDFAAALLFRARGDRNLTDVAFGWGCHLAVDHVGHDGSPPYLKNGHQMEMAADAWVYKHNKVRVGNVLLNATAIADPWLARTVGFTPISASSVEATWNRFTTFVTVEAMSFWTISEWFLREESICAEEPKMFQSALLKDQTACDEWLKVNQSWTLEEMKHHGRHVIDFAQTLLPICTPKKYSSPAIEVFAWPGEVYGPSWVTSFGEERLWILVFFCIFVAVAMIYRALRVRR
eukprot:GEMP01049881.1.p1 GENE.GEMP01049881.1~~GEMP01049881.1.p1  ORF type:complete len:280 (+),score=54.97 GEMP01049881.1:82-921(+)